MMSGMANMLRSITGGGKDASRAAHSSSRQSHGPSFAPEQRVQRHSMHQPAMMLQGHQNGPAMDFSTFGDDDEIAPLAAQASSSAAVAAQLEPHVSSEGPVSVTTRIEYAALPRGRAQDIFGIVTLQAKLATAASPDAEQRQPLDFICVLDVSGSMRGQKMQLVQDAIRFIINESYSTDRVSIVTFNSGAARPLRFRRMDSRGKQDALAVTSRLSAGGGTCITSGLEAALETAERRRARNPVSAILLLTDGQDGSSASNYVALLARAQRAGCALYAFGFGADHDARLLSDLAEQAQTPFTFVEDVGQIGAAFAGTMGGLASVVAQDVKVVIDCHATLKAVHTPFNVSREGGRIVILIPDLLAGERRDVLIELSVPEDTTGDCEETCLLQASAQYWDLAAGAAAQTRAADMVLRRTVSEQPSLEVEPDEEVVVQRHRWEVAQTLQEATAHGDAGRFEAAQQILGAQAAKMKACKKSSPVSEGLALELEDAQNRMKSRSSWENGGSAEVRDAMQMHKMQRATNVNMSSACTTEKRSKAMYITKCQESWVSKSKQ
mmetsp:Transcript_13974/g.49180  ORF Transcript_13974/g.49180 Transcript_13974/m.49180 type:complete len:552 (-) Transcript_13974:422-2077(-)